MKAGRHRDAADPRHLAPGRAEAGRRPYDWSTIDYQVYNAALVGAEVMPFLYSSPKWAVSGCTTATKCQSVPPTSSSTRSSTARTSCATSSALRRQRDVLERHHRPVRPAVQPGHAVPDLERAELADVLEQAVDASQYAQLVKTPTTRSRRARPRRQGVLLAGLFGTPQGDGASKNVMWKYLARLYKTPGISDSFDAVALHPYSPDINGLKFQLNKARKILDKHGDQYEADPRHRDRLELGQAAQRQAPDQGQEGPGEAAQEAPTTSC